MKLNADLGEGMAFDTDLMPLIDMANIACGGHAGDEHSMRATLSLAKKYQVVVGAHPSYPDRINFGRKSINSARGDLLASIKQQVSALLVIASEEGIDVSYIKPHGALYNDMMQDDALLDDLLAMIGETFSGKAFMLLATVDAQRYLMMAEKHGVRLMFETFADRAYQDNGRLVPRNQPGSCLTYSAALQQVDQLLHNQLLSQSGQELCLPNDSLCVHGDNPQALQLASAIRQVVDNR